MRIRPYDFITARSMAHALDLLERSGPDTRLIAGGTDLVLGMKKKTIQPKTVISLHGLTDLDFVAEENGIIRIGAMSRHADLAVNPVLETHVPILCQAVGLIGSWQIRHAGTIGGNLCNASPAADSAPPLLALAADVVLAGPSGRRIVPLTEFFTGPGQTAKASNEILTEIRIPRPANQSAGCYMKLRRRKAVDISLAGVAFQAETDAQGSTIQNVGIALGGVAPVPFRVTEAEDCLRGLSPEQAMDRIKTCAETAARAARPIDDLRADADYKRTIVDIFVQRSARHVLTILQKNRRE